MMDSSRAARQRAASRCDREEAVDEPQRGSKRAAGRDRPGDGYRTASAIVPAGRSRTAAAGTESGRAKATDLGVKATSPLVFFAVGDHGGIKDPNPQNAVT